MNGVNNYMGTDEKFKEHRKLLNEALEDATGVRGAKEKAYDTEQTKKAYTEKLLLKAIRANRLYTRVQNTVSVKAHKESELIKANIGIYNGQSDTLKAAFNETMAEINKGKTKIYDADQAACKVKEGLSDPAHNEQLKKLNELVKIGPDKKEFKTYVNEIIHEMNEAMRLINITVECGIFVSGIRTFTDIDTLTNIGDNLEQLVKALKTDVETNVTSTASQKDTNQAELITTIQDSSNKKYEMYRSKVDEKALEETVQRFGDEENHMPSEFDQIDPVGSKLRLENILDLIREDLRKYHFKK